MLQAVSYNAVEGEEDDDDVSQAGGSTGRGGVGRPSSMESLLLRKNRHLEHCVTCAKLKAAECGQQLEVAASRVAELEATLQVRCKPQPLLLLHEL